MRAGATRPRLVSLPPAPQGAPRGAGLTATGLALDEVLVRGATHAVRVWRPLDRAAVLGVASRASEELRLDELRADGVPVLRRSTGGAAVVIGPEVVCFSVVYPHEAFPGASRISGAYREVTSGLVAAASALGLEAEFRPPGDVACAGRKLVGLAQARRRRATVVHGVVPVSLDLAVLGRYLAHPPREPEYRAGRAHAEFVTTIERETGKGEAGPVLEALRSAFAGDASPEPPTGEETRRAHELATGRYLDPEWTFRR